MLWMRCIRLVVQQTDHRQVDASGDWAVEISAVRARGTAICGGTTWLPAPADSTYADSTASISQYAFGA